jgi:hypothetical protein
MRFDARCTMRQKNSVRTSVILSPAQYAQVSELAAKGDVSVAWIIRQAVQAYLDTTSAQQLPLPMRIATGKGDM